LFFEVILPIIVVHNGVLKAISISKITGSFQRIEGRIEGSRIDIISRVDMKKRLSKDIEG